MTSESSGYYFVWDPRAWKRKVHCTTPGTCAAAILWLVFTFVDHPQTRIFKGMETDQQKLDWGPCIAQGCIDRRITSSDQNVSSQIVWKDALDHISLPADWCSVLAANSFCHLVKCKLNLPAVPKSTSLHEHRNWWLISALPWSPQSKFQDVSFNFTKTSEF